MLTTSAIAETASLIGDPARANMLTALIDGRGLTAAELARAGGITPQTASGHLAKLVAAGWLAVEQQGRHRYHRLASPAVANMLEGIMALAAESGPPRRPVTTGPSDAALRLARTCYNHLAGRVAVAVADRMVERGHLELAPDGGALTTEGADFLRDLGVDVDATARGRSGRLFCRPCLDWSERRPHIAGAVGTALCRACFERNWLRRMNGTRAVQITPAGRLALRSAFGVAIDA